MIRLRQIKVPVQLDSNDYLSLKIKKMLKTDILNLEIRKKSIDARYKKAIYYVYEVDVLVNKEEEILKKYQSNNIFKAKIEEYQEPVMGKEKLKNKIIIVGAGPAGLFAGLMLSKRGYKVLILDRGEKIQERVKRVEEFWEKGILNVNSNVQFGEGGAGTFSDGKLNTLVKDKEGRIKKVLDIFYEYGANAEIKYLQYPHIGTDVLRKVVINMRNDIIKLGGEFRYNTTLSDLVIENNRIKKIIVNNSEEIPCDNLILAIGHSARDTFKMLFNNGLKMEAKSFAMGLRIMHDQEMINKSQYKDMAKYLPNANYKLTYLTKDKRGVYTFCMCPGGYVVNASSEENKLTINGMSNYKRDSKVANSAIVVALSPNDFGHDVFDGVALQRKLEEKAYIVGKGNIPLQTWIDYKNNQKTLKLGKLKPQIKGKYELANLNSILPEYMNEAIKEAINDFGKKIKGFDNPSSLLCGIEARTSSPIRIIRDNNMESNIKGIYPIGEGAGYAGGITTSAIDGIKVSEVLIKKYINRC